MADACYLSRTYREFHHELLARGWEGVGVGGKPGHSVRAESVAEVECRDPFEADEEGTLRSSREVQTWEVASNGAATAVLPGAGRR
jgi:hypothetical protein